VNKNKLNFAATALMLAALLSSTACKSTSNKGTGVTEYGRTEGARSRTTTVTSTATVTGIDASNRKITLTETDGTRKTFTAGPEVRNFDQLRIGDQVKTTMTEQVAVFLRKAGTSPSASTDTTITRAPEGAAPGVAMSDTSQITGRIIAIEGRHVTLQFADGSTRKIKVEDDVDLTRIAPGDAVTGQVTQSMVIKVEKP